MNVKEDKSTGRDMQTLSVYNKAVKALQEYNYKSEFIVMKETAVVYLADAVVSSIMYLLEKDMRIRKLISLQLATAVLRAIK